MKKKKRQKKSNSRFARRERKKKLIFSMISGVLLVGCTACACIFRDNVTWIAFAMGAVLALFGLLNALWRVFNRGILPVLAALCAILAVTGQFYYVTVDGHTYSTLVRTLDVSEEGLTNLEGIQRCRYLDELDVSGLGLTDVSPVYGLKGLSRLDMRGNPISEAHYNELQDALPETEILWSAPLGQTRQDNTVSRIVLPESGYVTLDMLSRQLGYFEDLAYVDLTQVQSLAAEDVSSLEAAYPQVQFAWMAPAGSGMFSTEETVLTLEGFDSARRLSEQLVWFRKLEKLDIRACDANYRDVQIISEALEGVQLSWQITYQGIAVTDETVTLDLTGVAISDITELASIVECIPALEKVSLKGTGIVNRDIYALVSQFPQVTFEYTLDVFGVSIASTDSQAILSGVTVNDAQVLAEALNHLPNLTYLDLGVCALSSEALKEIWDGHEDLEMVWQINIGGYTFFTDTEKISFNGNIFGDLTALEAALEYMPNVTYIDLCWCGQSDYLLAKFRDAHPDIKVVWMVNLGYWSVRSDATAFSTLGDSMTPYDRRATSENFSNLRYCTELRALDLGHQKIKDISFLENLTELRILILADNQISDISVLRNLPHLEYVELFMNAITDLSPLESCPNIVDLNLCYNYVTNVQPIAKLTKLQRLWMSGNKLSANNQAYLQNSLPGCKFNFYVGSSTGDGWREHKRYNTIREIFNEDKAYKGWND